MARHRRRLRHLPTRRWSRRRRAPFAGVVTADHRLFAGIPYAAPPVGPLRWQPPAPAVAWPGVRDATRFGPRCLQDDSDLELGRQTDEDCLSLNVWTPRPSNELRPVMVWIHGGAFVNGSGGIYDARWLAGRGDIVVVTLNYRLGALGFLAHPALGPAGAVGNYGLQDQQAALRWVRDNIAGFGGDPDEVTIAGESAGGMSVCDHLVAPGSAGLFRAAIMQSAPCQAQLALPDAERISVDYARDAGCGDPATAAECLRALPADKLRKPVWYARFGDDTLSGPITGTAVLPVDPMTAFGSGGAAKVPMMIGSNHDEFTLFVALQYLRFGKRFTAQDYPELLSNTFGADAGAVSARYPLERYDGSAALAYSAAVTDGMFACVADRMAAELAGSNSVYAYEFNDRCPADAGPLAYVAVSDRCEPLAGTALPLRRRRCAAAGPRPAGAVEPDDRLLEQVRRDGCAGRRWTAQVAGIRRRPGVGKSIVASARRQQAGQRFRRRAPVRVLGRPEEVTDVPTSGQGDLRRCLGEGVVAPMTG